VPLQNLNLKLEIVVNKIRIYKPELILKIRSKIRIHKSELKKSEIKIRISKIRILQIRINIKNQNLNLKSPYI